jgi:hypothetical protein
VRQAVLVALFLAGSAFVRDVAAASPPSQESATTTLDTVRVVAPRPGEAGLYRSKAPERTPPTVFENAWREPINLQKIGDEGGVVPLLSRYAAKKLAQGARRIPGWKPPVQAAVARAAPLEAAQLDRALRMPEAPVAGAP